MKKLFIGIVLMGMSSTLYAASEAEMSQRKALNCMARSLFEMKGGLQSARNIVSALDNYRNYDLPNAEGLYQECRAISKLPTQKYDLVKFIKELKANSSLNVNTYDFVAAAISPFSVCHAGTVSSNWIILNGTSGAQLCRGSNGSIWVSSINGISILLGPTLFSATAQYLFHIVKERTFENSYLVTVNLRSDMDGTSGVSQGVAAVFLGGSFQAGGLGNESYLDGGNGFSKIAAALEEIAAGKSKVYSGATVASKGVGLGVGMGYALSGVNFDFILKHAVINGLMSNYFNSFPTQIFNDGLAKALNSRYKTSVINKAHGLLTRD